VSDIADTRRAIEISQSYLPKKTANQLSSRAKEHYALYALTTARRMIAAGDIAGTISQIQEAFKCSCSLKVVTALLRFLMWAVARGTQRTVRQLSVQKKGINGS